jgi:hypothetical protein
MSSSFLSVCPNCRAKLKLKNPDLIGKRAKCPQCSEPFVVKRARVKARTEAAAAPAPAKKAPASAAPAAPEDDWLKDDLGAFDTDDTLAANADTATDTPIPPVVTGTRKKKHRSSSGDPSRRRRKSGYEEPSVAVSCLLAILAGGFAAVIGGAIWVTIMIVTGYEIGLLAWAIGGLVGFGTLLGSREHIVGDISGMIGAAVALMAVTGPKFLLLGLGLLLGMQVGLGDLFSPFDALWILLAVGTAFRVASGQAGEE